VSYEPEEMSADAGEGPKSKAKQTALATVPQTKPIGDLNITAKQFAEVAINSGLYKDLKDLYGAYAKMALGASMGIDPATAMSNIILVNGKMSFTAALVATRVKQSDKYRYEVVKKDSAACEVQFYEKIPDWTPEGKQFYRWIRPGPVERFTVEMAKRAGLTSNPTWAKYPEAMCFARCLTAGARTYCPDVFCGNAIYTPEELAPEKAVVTVGPDGNVEVTVDAGAEAKPAAAPKVKVTVPAKDPRWAELKTLLGSTATDEGVIKDFFSVERVGVLTDEQLDKAIDILRKKARAQTTTA
jgi:hypothetical protein